MAARVITVVQCMKECCSADGKTYAFIILGRFLQATAMTGTLASFTSVFFFGPAALLGTLPAVGLFALGHFLVKKNIPLKESILFSHPAVNWLIPKAFIRGQPVGLVNSFSSCWINASLQCIIQIPALRERACRIPELAQFIQQYQQIQNSASQAESLNGENLNTFLIAAMRLREIGEISEENRHVDAAKLFEWLFGQHPLHQFLNITTRPNQVAFPPVGEVLIQLQLTPNTPVHAQTLFNHFFDYNADGIRHELRFINIPHTIAVKLNRIYGHATNPADPTSFQRNLIEDPVEGMDVLTLPQGASLSSVQARYFCKAFILHLGPSLDSGHYIACVKKDGKWWLCDDQKVSEISEEKAMEQMKKSYLLFLDRG